MYNQYIDGQDDQTFMWAMLFSAIYPSTYIVHFEALLYCILYITLLCVSSILCNLSFHHRFTALAHISNFLRIKASSKGINVMYFKRACPSLFSIIALEHFPGQQTWKVLFHYSHHSECGQAS